MRWCKCNVYPWWCHRTYLLVMQISPYRDGDAKCLVVQMPFNGHVMIQMLLVGMSWCKCPLGACHDANVHLWVCLDANVHVGMPWCKCPLVGMPWCKCSWYVCHDVNAPLWVCHDMNVHVCVSWGECFDANTIYSKIPFISKTRLPQRLKPKYFHTWFIKKSSSFWLKAPKKLVITVRKSLSGAFTWKLMIWLKKLIFTILIGQKGWHISKVPFFGKMNYLKIKHLKKIHFVVLEYGNLTSVKTHRDRLENLGGGHFGKEGSIFLLWKR